MFDLFLSLKLAHILAAILMVGATVINGLIHNQARRVSPVEAGALLGVVITVNRYLMGPSLFALPLTGAGLVWVAGHSFEALWLMLSVAFSFLLVAAFIFGARLEHQLYTIASSAADTQRAELPAKYAQLFGKAAPIGGAALLMSLAVLTLMIFKPF